MEEIDKLITIIKIYKIKNYEQKILIDQLKNKIYNEEIIKKFYINKVNIRSKL